MQVLTLPEAATELRKSRRWLQEWLAKHPADSHGRPFCSRLGKTRGFRPADIQRILEANATVDTPSCRSISGPRAKAKARTGKSAAHTSTSLWTEAQELLKRPS